MGGRLCSGEVRLHKYHLKCKLHLLIAKYSTDIWSMQCRIIFEKFIRHQNIIVVTIAVMEQEQSWLFRHMIHVIMNLL